MASFSKCWADLKAQGYKHANGKEVLTDNDKQSILDRTETFKKEDGLSHGEAIRKSLQEHHDEAHAQVQSIHEQVVSQMPTVDVINKAKAIVGEDGLRAASDQELARINEQLKGKEGPNQSGREARALEDAALKIVRNSFGKQEPVAQTGAVGTSTAASVNDLEHPFAIPNAIKQDVGQVENLKGKTIYPVIKNTSTGEIYTGSTHAQALAKAEAQNDTGRFEMGWMSKDGAYGRKYRNTNTDVEIQGKLSPQDQAKVDALHKEFLDTFDSGDTARKFAIIDETSAIYRAARKPTSVPEPPVSTTGSGIQKPSEPVQKPAEVAAEQPPPAEPPTPVVPTPAETAATNSGETTGIAARYREDELGAGSVIPGVGRTADEARAWGHDFINKGGNPYDAINQKGPKRELWQDVGIARAEYERLGNEKRAAEAQMDANPNDAQAKMAFDNADAAQRKWSKDAQPVLTRAGDALRAASRAYPREINTFSDFTDIVNDHFKGEVELTPEKRAELQKAVKAIQKGNVEATQARAQVTDAAVRKAGGKILSFNDLKTELQNKMTKLLEDCPI